MISSKEMWPIISFFWLTSCTILRGGQLRNCVSRFWDKILSAHGSSNISHLKSRRRISERPIHSIFQSSFRFWSWGWCQWEPTSRIRRRNIIYIAEVVYTNPRRHVNCIHEDLNTIETDNFTGSCKLVTTVCHLKTHWNTLLHNSSHLSKYTLAASQRIGGSIVFSRTL
jgi:hypothetical protein